MTVPGNLSSPLLATAADAAAAAVATKSLRFNSGDSSYLNRTPSSAGNRKTFTFSAWVKKTEIISSGDRQIFGSDSSGGAEFNGIAFISTNALNFRFNDSGSVQIRSSALHRDPSAWLHIVCAADTSQATASNRLKMYVNGAEVTDFSSSTYPSQNAESSINSTQVHEIGRRAEDGGQYFNGYLADIHFIDGSALDATSFGAYDDNGVWQAAAYSGTYGTNGFHLGFGDSSSSDALGTDSSGNSNTFAVNNLAAGAPGLSTADQGFGVLTYTGNATARNISGLSFAPDLVIIKSRSDSGFHHYWIDRVRGTGKNLFSNLTEGEQSADRLSSFNSDGIGLTDHSGVNKSGSNFVAWCWKAGGSASSNTNGTITSSVSASTTYGFSVVGYTGNNTSGATVGHGLSSAPKWIVVKSRDQNGQFWHVYHASLAANEYIYLNSNAVKTSGNDFMNGTRPTSSVFSLGNGNGCNKSSDNVIAYCWSEVSGFSKFDEFSGDGNSGKKITTGFKPKFVIIKRTDTIENWHIFDSERGGTKSLFPDLGNAEVDNSSRSVAFVSDGFTLGTQGGINASGGTYIYAAFADVPNGADIDSLFDVPTNGDQTDTGAGGEVSGNYATMNALHNPTGSSFSNGNLQVSNSGGWYSHTGTIGVASGKWYYEFEKTSGSYTGVGWRNDITTAGNPSFNANGGGIYLSHNGNKQSSAGSSSYGATWGSGDIIGVAFDRDAGTITYYKNNVSQGQAFTGMTDGTFFPEVQIYQSGGVINFGQRPFAYTAPSGYKALCTTNLPTPTIADGSDYFEAKLYTTETTISGLSFSPDWVWLKRRSQSADNGIYDTVRGVNKLIYTNATNSEETGGGVSAFNSDGFDLGTNALFKGGGHSFVSWNWDAGSSTASNTDGSITSSVRANQTAGFSIVSYAGTGSNATVGHGLSAAPHMYIVKNRSNAYEWGVYHIEIGTGAAQNLNYSNNNSVSNTWWNNTAPTSSVFSIGTYAAVNQSSANFIAYCFAPVAGFSAFGKAVGNNSTDGPFVFTGFRPRFIIWRPTASGHSWLLIDTARDTYNIADATLRAHNNSAESHFDWGDILSNGFKIRNTDTNPSGVDIIWAAWAENPFQANGGLAR